MKPVWIGALALSAAALAAGPTAAQSLRLAVQPDAAAVHFLLDATLHKVEGTAILSLAEMTLDPATGAAEGRFVVDATSLETGNRRRDREMHRKVLESETYPEIVFRPERIGGTLPPAGAFEIELEGTLELQGAEHARTLLVRGERDGDRIEATAGFTIPYVAWGLRDPSKLVLRVAKQVEVEIELAAELEEVPE